MKKFNYAVTVGRFQVADLHYAHIKIIYDLLSTHEKVLIFLGVSSAQGTSRDPLDFQTRERMIKKQFPNILIEQIKDQISDEVWSHNLDKKIKEIFPKGSVCIYGGRDSFLEHYNGKYPTKEFPKINHWPGTTIRQNIGKTVKDSAEWREGQIYLSQNQFPRLFTTVDAGVVRRNESDQLEVLLAQKQGEKTFRFIGGFVDPTDESLEHAVRREVFEETDIEIGNVKYLCSHKVNDWRYKNTSDGIMTNFFICDYIYGSTFKPKDDICNLEWYVVNKNTEKLIYKPHLKLYKKLVEYLSDRKEVF